MPKKEANHTKNSNSNTQKISSSKIKQLGNNAKEEFSTECNPDNNAWFANRSNPLSSKGN